MIWIEQVVNELADVHCPLVEIATRSKLSCLSWNKCAKPLIASSDYEGTVTVWDVNTRQVLEELIFDMCTLVEYIAVQPVFLLLQLGLQSNVHFVF